MIAAKLSIMMMACLPGTLPTQDDAIEAAVLKALELKNTPAALRAFVAAKTPLAITDERFTLLVRDLRVEDFKTREAAQAELVRGGPAVLDRLRASAEAIKYPDQVGLIKGCIIRITKEWSPRGVAAYRAAIRAVARRPDATAVPCLLGTLPTVVEDDEVLAAVWRALDVVAVRTGAVPPACADARTDPRPELRAVAAFLLGRRGTEEQRRHAVGMLKDPVPTVRLRAAQGLLGVGDLSGVPTLVSLLDAKPVTLAWEAEELLVWLAGKGGPAARVGDGREAAKVQVAWAGWWETAKPDWKAAAAAPGRPILLLVRDDDPEIAQRPTVLVGCDGRVRWTASPPHGQRLVVDRVTSTGAALGFAWPNPDPRPDMTLRFPGLAEFRLGEVPRRGPELTFAPGSDGGMIVRRWSSGLTLVAGPERFGFVSPSQNSISEWGTLPLIKENAEDPGQERRGRVLGERNGVLWYACNTPPSKDMTSVLLIEPGTGQGLSLSPSAAVRLKVPRWNEIRTVSGATVLSASNWRVSETVQGQTVWDVRVGGWLVPAVSSACPLVRFGFDDLMVARREVPAQ